MEHVKSELGVYADAAATESPALEEEVVEISSDTLGTKRKKPIRLEAAQHKVTLIGERIEKKQKMTDLAKAKASSRSKEKEALSRWEPDMHTFLAQQRAAREALQLQLDVWDAADAAKKAKAVEQVEISKAETSVAEEMNIVNEELSGGLEEGPGEGSQDAASHVVHLKNTLTKGTLTSSLPRARL
ncbi:MAG: hypothetical protein SGPRY_007537 [Prymnesium sp.]